MTYTSAIDVDALFAIDIHVHAGISATAPPTAPSGAPRQDTLSVQTQRTGAGGQTPEQTAAYYRERKIAAAIWGVDPQSTGGFRPGGVSNDEMLEAASANNDILIPFVMVDPWRGKAGAREAQRLIDAKLIHGAFLALQGQMRSVGVPAVAARQLAATS
jgi:predicted TIM-barrel fold metal-dependent hydrolase